MNDYRTVAVSADDAEECLALSTAAGWNQTVDDWRLILDLGTARGVRDSKGELVGSIATLHYDPLDWHAMLLVASDHQGRGIGSQLFRDAVARSDAAGRPSGLDATPAGRPIYETVGFAPVAELVRMEARIMGGSSSKDDAGLRTDSRVTPVPAYEAEPSGGATPLPAAEERELVGFRRPQVLAAIAERGGLTRGPADKRAAASPGTDSIQGAAACSSTAVQLREESLPFALLRPGRTAWQLGPVYAPSGDAAAALLDWCIREVQRRRPVLPAPTTLFVDIPTTAGDRSAREVENWLAGRGFTAQRPFTRMIRPAPGQHIDGRRFAPAGQVFAVAGPEYG